MHLQRATLYCSVQPFLKPWGSCYSIALIKRLHCQDAFVLQTLISQRSLASKRPVLYLVLWINSAWNLYDQEACMPSSLSYSLVYFSVKMLRHSVIYLNINTVYFVHRVCLCVQVCMCLKAVLHPEGDYLKWRN